MRISFTVNRRRGAIIGAVVALASIAGCLAYFASIASSPSSPVVVGNLPASKLTVTYNTVFSGGPITPGSAAVVLKFVVANTDTANPHTPVGVTYTFPALANGDAETTAGADIPGCLAVWFQGATDASSSSFVGTAIAANGNAPLFVDVTMPALSTANQGACAGATVAVVANVSAN